MRRLMALLACAAILAGCELQTRADIVLINDTGDTVMFLVDDVLVGLVLDGERGVFRAEFGEHELLARHPVWLLVWGPRVIDLQPRGYVWHIARW